MFNRKTGSDFIPELHQLCTLNMPEESRIDKISRWLVRNARNLDESKVKRTFVIAGREDLADAMHIEVQDVDLHDTVRSVQTGRVGKVIGVKGDGESIVVSWETGGQQLLSKGNVVKLRSATDFQSFIKAQTECDGYKDLNKKVEEE